MANFTWFMMLYNWYCWHGDEPVAVMKLVDVHNQDIGYHGSSWHYWFAVNNDYGYMNADYWTIDQVCEEIERRYLEIKQMAHPFVERTVPRFQYNVWNGQHWEDTVCDVYYIDRLTGKEVLRYDAADPANTNPHYGAESDYWKMHKRGYDLEQRIPAVLGR